ncbi:BTB/POZ domain-containing protein 1-like [Actinia tenebrosa]|uniref:BTB/POZ domain-containing protein 1-like n=1 Tax=Actinia tenebrosa TaxID=6105 RepID=A0A6P8II57_ACTTE|nr:BTB/POZ domain-containing protein 1-like [Actinia tenebrosa]
MEPSDWQTKLSSFKERHLYAYNNSSFCDVEFSVMDANGDKVTIPANKYVLAISSPVFQAMFYGKSAETGRTIDLPDCTKEGLQEMLRYFYSDEVNLTGSKVLDVLYLAEKYMLPFLKEKCEEHLQKELKPEEVFHVLPQIRNEKVEQKCWDMVDSDAERAVSSESFLNVSKEMLCKVLGRDTMSIDEVVLFQAVEKWALNKLKEQGLEESMENKRAVLGEEVIKLIRFPLMSQKEFAEKVLPSGILKTDEETELTQFFNGTVPRSRSFSNAKRGKSQVFLPKIRFDSIIKPCDAPSQCFGVPEAIDFKVNNPLSLVGVRLFGAKGSTYDVTLALYKSDQKITEISSALPTEDEETGDGVSGLFGAKGFTYEKITQISSTFPTEDEETDGYYGFTILLDEPVPLDPDVVYTIEATISGPNFYHGKQGKTTIAFEDMVITYLDSRVPTCRTSSQEGQYPSLLFRRP